MAETTEHNGSDLAPVKEEEKVGKTANWATASSPVAKSPGSNECSPQEGQDNEECVDEEINGNHAEVTDPGTEKKETSNERSGGSSAGESLAETTTIQTEVAEDEDCGNKDGDKSNDEKESEEERQKSMKRDNQSTASGPIVSSTKRTRPPYKYDPEKVTLRFLFANKDGLTVTVECKPGDTVGEVKGQLLSVWPEGKRRKMRM